jgi:hypothetical protein
MNENRSHHTRSNGDTQRHAPRLGPEHETAGTHRTGESERYREAGYRSGETGQSGYGRGDYEPRADVGDSDQTWRADAPGLHETDREARPGLSVTTLLRSLAGDAATLTRKEMTLARGEVSQAISSLKTGIIASATGGGVLFAGLLFLLLAATLGLATVMAGWLAALIVGGVVFLFGLILVGTGKKKMEADNFRPDRTIDSMRKDQEMLHRRTPQ